MLDLEWKDRWLCDPCFRSRTVSKKEKKRFYAKKKKKVSACSIHIIHIILFPFVCCLFSGVDRDGYGAFSSFSHDYAFD